MGLLLPSLRSFCFQVCGVLETKEKALQYLFLNSLSAAISFSLSGNTYEYFEAKIFDDNPASAYSTSTSRLSEQRIIPTVLHRCLRLFPLQNN